MTGTHGPPRNTHHRSSCRASSASRSAPCSRCSRRAAGTAQHTYHARPIMAAGSRFPRAAHITASRCPQLGQRWARGPGSACRVGNRPGANGITWPASSPRMPTHRRLHAAAGARASTVQTISHLYARWRWDPSRTVAGDEPGCRSAYSGGQSGGSLGGRISAAYRAGRATRAPPLFLSLRGKQTASNPSPCELPQAAGRLSTSCMCLIAAAFGPAAIGVMAGDVAWAMCRRRLTVAPLVQAVQAPRG